MSFTWPWALWALLLVPLVIGAYVLAQRTRRRDTLRYSNVGLVREAVGRGPGWKRHVPAALYVVALAALLFAFARPRFALPSTERSGTVILALDVSGSMRSFDVKPSRIEAAIAAIQEFVNKQPHGVRIGLVAFADSGQLLTPPTDDKKQVLQALNHLRLQRGTNIGDGLQVSLDAILRDQGIEDTVAPAAGPGGVQPTPQALQQLADPSSATIVLLSDGAATTGPDPLKVAETVAQTGVKIYTVGIGASAGQTNQGAQGSQGGFQGGFGRGGFFELDEVTLKGIADKTGGKYFPASSAGQLNEVYDHISRQTSFETRTTEATAAVVAGAFVVMLLSGALGMLWFNRLP